jgi:gamma-glutamylcyclotransferase (GGCT)/AIG2-like uncharacterized protein YtfP
MTMTTSEAQTVKGPRKHTTRRGSLNSIEAVPAPLLRLAAYGTLMKGGLNHDRFCTGILSIESVTLLGRLEWLSEFVPRLHVPEESILAEGTTDYEADVALQAEISGGLGHFRGGRRVKLHSAGWDEVPAEILTFDDPRSRLLRIDHLEGFVPGKRNFYRRVLVPIVDFPGQTAWVYVSPDSIARRRP